MVSKYIKFSIIITIILIIISLSIYWYYNPSVNNKDFHLEFEVSNSNRNFYKDRNTNISDVNYTYNNEIYYNNKEQYKLILHSLDFTKIGERIIIVVDFLDKKNRIANITYKNRTGEYSTIDIKYKKDSIFIIQKLESISTGENEIIESKNVIFAGIK